VSTMSSLLVERVVNVSPHVEQRTFVSVSSGWICFKKIAS